MNQQLRTARRRDSYFGCCRFHHRSLLKVPEDLDRFKDMAMRVQYHVEGDDDLVARQNMPKDSVVLLESVDVQAQHCVWKLADVKENRAEAGKGRPLNRKQRDWRLQTSFEAVKKATMYLEARKNNPSQIYIRCLGLRADKDNYLFSLRITCQISEEHFREATYLVWGKSRLASREHVYLGGSKSVMLPVLFCAYCFLPMLDHATTMVMPGHLAPQILTFLGKGLQSYAFRYLKHTAHAENERMLWH